MEFVIGFIVGYFCGSLVGLAILFLVYNRIVNSIKD